MTTPTMHDTDHEHKGAMVLVKAGVIPGTTGEQSVRLVNWWDRVDLTDRMSVWDAMTFAATAYCNRAMQRALPFNDEVVYVKLKTKGGVGELGYGIHVSELVDVRE